MPVPSRCAAAPTSLAPAKRSQAALSVQYGTYEQALYAVLGAAEAQQRHYAATLKLEGSQSGFL